MSPSAYFPEGSKHIVFGGQATGQSRCHDKWLRIKDMPPVKLDHCVKAHGIPVERGPLQRFGAKGPGTSVYFRDPDGSLMEFMSYGDSK